MVLQQGIRRLRQRRLENPRLPQERADSGSRFKYRHRAHTGPAHRRYPYRPTGCGHRAQGLGSRAASGCLGGHGRSAGQAEHQRGQGSRSRRRTPGARCRRPDRESDCVPPRHEACHRIRLEGRCRRRACRVQGPSRRRRHGSARVVPRRPGAASHPARGHRLRDCHRTHHCRDHRGQGLGLSRRGDEDWPGVR